MNKKVQLVDIGVMDYLKAYELQQKLLKLRQENKIMDTVLLVEHPRVLTKGLNTNQNNIIASDEFLRSQGIAVYQIKRGGDVTYHGPGQLVGYLIMNIKELEVGVKKFVDNLEQLFIEVLKHYDIKGGRSKGHTGTWVGNEKITAIGIQVKRYVTMHGFAFNVNTDLNDFNLIVPCGINDKGVTSIQKLIGQSASMDTVKKLVEEAIEKVFDVKVTQIEKDDLFEQVLEGEQDE